MFRVSNRTSRVPRGYLGSPWGVSGPGCGVPPLAPKLLIVPLPALDLLRGQKPHRWLRGEQLLVLWVPKVLNFNPFWGHQNASRASRPCVGFGFFFVVVLFQPQPAPLTPGSSLCAGRARLGALLSQFFFPYLKKNPRFDPKRCSIQNIALLTSRSSFFKKTPQTQLRANSGSGPSSGCPQWPGGIWDGIWDGILGCPKCDGEGWPAECGAAFFLLLLFFLSILRPEAALQLMACLPSPPPS